jgi:hypothetical protein
VKNMPLRSFVRASPETLSDLLLAAEDRYLDGEDLLLQQRFDGCVYLFGYAAEMWLKAACILLRGHGPTTGVNGVLPTLKSWMKLNVPHVPFVDYHDLTYFVECAAQLRASQGRPLPFSPQSELRTRIATGLGAEWIVDMRYRRSALAASDAWNALHNVWWMKTNWTNLI